jgi:hypothetical protein
MGTTTGTGEKNDSERGQTETLNQEESPWRNYQPRVLNPRTNNSISRKANGVPKLDRNDHWDVTPRARRVELLDPEEQELAAQLARTDLNARDQRSILGKMTRYSSQAQSHIFECSTILRLAKQVAECHD